MVNVTVIGKGLCALSDVEITLNKEPGKAIASLDRIDSNKGYALDNVQWITKDINFMKRKYTQEYFVETCKKIAAKNFSETP